MIEYTWLRCATAATTSGSQGAPGPGGSRSAPFARFGRPLSGPKPSGGAVTVQTWRAYTVMAVLSYYRDECCQPGGRCHLQHETSCTRSAPLGLALEQSRGPATRHAAAGGAETTASAGTSSGPGPQFLQRPMPAGICHGSRCRLLPASASSCSSTAALPTITTKSVRRSLEEWAEDGTLQTTLREERGWRGIGGRIEAQGF